MSTNQKPLSLEMRRFVGKLKNDVVPALAQEEQTDDEIVVRGLTALVLTTVGGMLLDNAPLFVTDSPNDLGIDGIYYNHATKILFVVQAKFRFNQLKTIDQGEVLKFLDGVRRLINADITNASPKLISAFASVEEAFNDINTKIVLIIACTSIKELELNVTELVDRFCREQNQSDDAFSWRYISFNELFKSAKLFSATSSVDVDIVFDPFSKLTGPFQSFYGCVTADQVADWVVQNGERLFDQNVRGTLSHSDVNDAMLGTIKNEPRNFWYFNNGITAIAANATPTPGDTLKRKVGAQSFSIVNGAQTAGMLARARNDGLDLSDVKVQLRVISLANADPGLDEQITRANNTQNRLDALDFVSLDAQHEVIRNELSGFGFSYRYKRGGSEDHNIRTIEVKDAAIALACNNNLNVTAQAKRYVSGLWNDINSSTYKSLFNSHTTGLSVLIAWRRLNAVERACRDAKQNSSKDVALILTHGERFLAHCLNTILKGSEIGAKTDDERRLYDMAIKLIAKLPEAYQTIPAQDRSYPPSDFKNVSMLEKIKLNMQLEKCQYE